MGLDYDVSFDEIREDRETLLAYIRDAGGPKELADILEVPYDTLTYWRIQKHNIMYEDYKDYKDEDIDLEVKKNEPESPYTLEEDGFEINFSATSDRNYEDKGDHYLVETQKGTIRIKKEKLQEFKRLYCGVDNRDNLTKKQCSRELGIPLDHLQLIKKAFDITHNDIEFTDEELLKYDEEELIKKKLNAKKRSMKKKLQQAEYKEAIKENRKFREKDYYTDKSVNKVISALDNINFDFNFTESNSTKNDCTLVINISDWHTGKLVEAGSIIGHSEGFNKNIYKERINKYLNESVKAIDKYKPERVLILDYGDGMDNPEANQYKSQQKYQDISYEEQFVQHVTDLSNFITTIRSCFDNVKYSKVPGNHSKGEINWDVLAGKMLDKMLKDTDIEIDSGKKPIKNFKIYGFNLLQMHGDEMTTRIDTPSSKAQSLGLVNIENLSYKTTYIVQGHLHHQAEEGAGYTRILLPSIIGGDDLSNNKMKVTSRPAQELFIFEKGEGLTIRKTVYLD